MNNMEETLISFEKKQFVNYDLAVKLKNMGFNEKCFAYYLSPIIFELACSKNQLQYPHHRSSKSSMVYHQNDLPFQDCSAPLYQQVVNWIRKIYNIDIVVLPQIKVIPEKFYYYMLFVNGEEIKDWADRFSNILDKSEQDISGHHINDKLLEKYLFEDKFAFKTYEECLEHALIEGLKLIK
jgi:hypothetical protein